MRAAFNSLNLSFLKKYIRNSYNRKINKKPTCSYNGCSSFGTFKTENGFMCKRHSAE